MKNKNEKYFLNSLRFALCHVALSPIGSGHITADKRLKSCRLSPKFLANARNFFYPHTLWCILKDEIADKDRHENHQEFFLTVLDLHSTADNFVLTFPTVIKSR